MTQIRIRNDGKPARTPRLGLQPGGPLPGPGAAEREPSPSWHELVQPGPAGFPAETHARREELGQVRPQTSTYSEIKPPARGPVRTHYRRLRAHRTGELLPFARLRVQKGSRTPGFAEVRHGGVAAGMAKIRQRPVTR